MDNETEKIQVYGARVHNLKNVDVELPRNSLTVITGLSGSGKSSLAFDTIFAEGQRRYIETFSAYARNFLTRVPPWAPPRRFTISSACYMPVREKPILTSPERRWCATRRNKS